MNLFRITKHQLIKSSTNLILQRMKNLTLFLASFLLFFTSCSVQKRTYRPGFTVQWKGDKFQKDNEEIAQDNVENEDIDVMPDEREISNRTTISSDKLEPTISNDPRIETSNNFTTQEAIFLKEAQPKEVGFRAEKTPSYQTKKYSRFSNGISFDHKATTSADDEGGNGALKAIGWIFIILGIVLLIFVSILIGILLMLLGLLFFVVGKSS